MEELQQRKGDQEAGESAKSETEQSWGCEAAAPDFFFEWGTNRRMELQYSKRKIFEKSKCWNFISFQLI